MMRIDWSWTSVVVALCALAATRPLREGTLQASRRWPSFLGADWRVAPPFRLLGRWHLVGLPLLLTESVLLEPSPEAGRDASDDRETGSNAGNSPDAESNAADKPDAGAPADVDARTQPGTTWEAAFSYADSRLPLAVAQVVGFASFFLVAFLLPIAVASHGLVGLIMALCLLANTTLIASLAMAWAEWQVRTAYGIPEGGFRVRLQSPFSVPHAATTVLDRVLGPLGAAEAVRRLLPDRGLRAWLRPYVHDQRLAGRQQGVPAVAADIVARLDAREVAAASARPERCLIGERYCPRCGSCYESSRTSCADCPGAPALA